MDSIYWGVDVSRFLVSKAECCQENARGHQNGALKKSFMFIRGALFGGVLCSSEQCCLENSWAHQRSAARRILELSKGVLQGDIFCIQQTSAATRSNGLIRRVLSGLS